MGCQDALAALMPIDELDPYGRTPMANGMEMSVDITIVETDDGIRVSSVKNPPKSGPSRLMEAIKQALGVDSLENSSLCKNLQADDQGKQKDSESTEKSDYSEKKNSNDKKPLKDGVSNAIMESTSPSASRGQGSQPWAGGKSEVPLTTDSQSRRRGGDEESAEWR